MNEHESEVIDAIEEELDPKEIALRKYLDLDDDVKIEQRGDEFTVSPSTRLIGTSPERAKELATLVREALLIATSHMEGLPFTRTETSQMPASVDDWTSAMLRESASTWQIRRTEGFKNESLSATYNTLKRLIESNPRSKQLLSVGLHDLANSLYFLYDTKPSDHALSIQEAFDRKKVRDRRRSEPCDDGSYMVLDDDEADELWEEYLESYLDECVPGSDGPYFDREAWKRDARHDGRGHCLASYDGSEGEQKVDCETYFIYRTG